STDTIAAGSPATNEYRPHRSERSTLSSRTPGPSLATDGNTPTGVETSEDSSVHTGTRGHSRRSASNSSRSGWIGSPSMFLPPKEEAPGGSPRGRGILASCLGSDAQRRRVHL